MADNGRTLVHLILVERGGWKVAVLRCCERIVGQAAFGGNGVDGAIANPRENQVNPLFPVTSHAWTLGESLPGADRQGAFGPSQPPWSPARAAQSQTSAELALETRSRTVKAGKS